jgi:hypothetical protein
MKRNLLFFTFLICWANTVQISAQGLRSIPSIEASQVAKALMQRQDLPVYLVFTNDNLLPSMIEPSDSVEFFPEQTAQYTGGIEALQRFISENLKYPDDVQGKSTSINVKISAIVDKTGLISKVYITQSQGAVFDAEALRVVSLMPIWKPAQNKDIPVASAVHLKVNFVK